MTILSEILTKSDLQKIRCLQKISLFKTINKIAQLTLLWIIYVVVILNTSSLVIQLVCSLVIALVIHSFAIFSHDGIHENLANSKALNFILAFILGLSGFFPSQSYRVVHHLHHRFTGTKQDPDTLPDFMKIRSFKITFFILWHCVGTPIYLLLLPIHAVILGTYKEKVICIIEALFLVIIYVSIYKLTVKHGLYYFVISLWLMPAIFASFIANFRGYAEHMHVNHSDNPLNNTRTILSNRVISYFFNYQNYHLEHHLFVKLPWYNLRKAHEIVSKYYLKNKTNICSGYLEFIFSLANIKHKI